MKKIIACLLFSVLFFPLILIVQGVSAENDSYFYDVTLDKEGEILGDGDVIVVTCKLANSEIVFDSCYALINAYSNNIRVDLIYDNTKGLFVGAYTLGDTSDNAVRPCYIMMISSPYEFGVNTYFNEYLHPFGEKVFIYNNKCKNGIHYPQITSEKFEASCISNGQTEEIICSLCKTIISASSVIPATNHSNATIDNGTPATCTQTGFTAGKYCPDCKTWLEGHEVIPTSAHTYTSSITTEATCFKEGVKTYTCACGDTYTEAIAKLSTHTYNSVVTAPTCASKGYTTYTCECGDTYVADYIDASHTWGEWMPYADFINIRYCSICEESEIDFGEIKNFIVGTDGSNIYLNWDDVPGARGYRIYGIVDNTFKSIKTLTDSKYQCTDTQYTTFSVRAYIELNSETYWGHHTVANISCYDHIYNSVITPPTCSNQGYTTHTCKCGKSYTSDFYETLHHIFTNYISDGTATCVTDGRLIAKCDNCDVTDSVIEKGTHKFSEDFTIDVNPTCTTNGEKSRHCLYCSEITDKTSIDKIAHNYNIITINPTCTDRGHKIYTCNCGANFDETIPAKGHNFSGSACTDCGYNRANDCSCNSHKSGISAIIWKIINIFNKLLKKNPVCACGAVHY